MLILGEGGSGKTLAARELHARSELPGQPFVVQSCASISDEQLERELFGSVRPRSRGALARAERNADQAQAALREIARVLADAGALPNERRNRDWRQIPGLDELSPREVQVLEALLAHRRPPQIAEDLGISPHTVRNHLKSIYAKCGVRSQAELLQLIVDGGKA